MRNEQEYNIGLDIGTESVGWAVIDDNSNVVKTYTNGKRKRMWGSLLFDEGKTASDRRRKRSERRRKNRRKERIKLLQDIFREEINKVDPLFFHRLEESKLYLEDRDFTNNYSIFKSIEECKKFNEDYKTIYHLRNTLCESKEKIDIRFIYLALHHIIKYRGNFLYEGQNIDIKNINIKEQFITLFDSLNNIKYIVNPDIDYENIKSILLNKKISNSEKSDQILSNIKYEDDNKANIVNIIKLILGLSGDLNKILDLDNLDKDELKKMKINLSTIDSEKENEVINLLGEYSYILEQIKDIYNSVNLIKILGDEDNSSISKYMIKKYDEHKNDLKLLKEAVKEYDIINKTSKYDEFFKDKTIGQNYETYIRNSSKFDYESLKKKIKEIIVGTKNENIILEKLDKDEFLLKLNTVINSAIPYQLHLDELNKIIENQKIYYPFLGETILINNESIYKISKILTFKIPYYVGPIVSSNCMKSNPYAWFSRKEGISSSERITPYNFEQIVDLEKSSEDFILNMVKNCTYIPDAKVLPRHSLLYSEFCVLNELKQITIDGKHLQVDIIKRIYNELFKKHKNITDKIFREWLLSNNLIIDLDVKIKGYQSDNKFASSLKSYNDFKEIFDLSSYKNINTVETLIKWITIYEDKKILKRRIENEFGEISKEDVAKILTFKYVGWANMSKELLESEEIGFEENGEWFTIMSLMRNTNENFMQIINNKKYKIQEKLNNLIYSETKEDIVYDDIASLHCSPSVKKGIWQSILLVKEIIDIMGHKPKHIYIEFARNEDKKERKANKKDQILSLYDTVKNEIDNYNELIKELKNCEKIDSEKAYLYFMQQGRSLYSGARLNFNELSSYEVDHIVPRSLIKDDSIDNKALVLKEENQRKSDGTLSIEYQKKMANFWEFLLDKGFISKKKYNNLKLYEFNKDILDGFINRQLVETRQIIINTTNLLNSYLGDECVCAIRANLSHDFREKYSMYKFRDINNHHHAHDAYLAASIGNFLYKSKFYDNKNLVYSDFKYVFDKNKYKKGHGFILDKIDDETANKICEHLYYNDPIVIKKPEIQTGEYYGQTIYPSIKNQSIRKTESHDKIIPLKNNLDCKKYGGYNSLEKSYFLLIEYINGKKEEKRIISIPIKYMNMNEIDIIKYLEQEGYSSPVIIGNKIYKNQIIEFKNHKFYISSDTELVNAVEFHFTKSEFDKYKELLNFILNTKNKNDNNVIDLSLIDDLIVCILDKMKRFYTAYNSEYEKIAKIQEDNLLNQISNEDKFKLIRQLFVIMSANPNNGNLKFLNVYGNLNLGDRIGRKNGQSLKTGTILYTSLTGLREKRVDF